MVKECYKELEAYMLSCMEDNAHDSVHGSEHIYRVLNAALEIAEQEENIDYDVLIAACLLHDIGRKEASENPGLCHAQAGSEKAFAYLLSHGWPAEKAEHVRDCICTHSFRKGNRPESIEAKIVFDADKIDAAGAVGIARTLMYKAQVGEPLYSRLPDGMIADGSGEEPHSFFQEYHFKLKNLYDQFYTERGREIALERKQAAEDFYRSMLKEVQSFCQGGRGYLERLLSQE